MRIPHLISGALAVCSFGFFFGCAGQQANLPIYDNTQVGSVIKSQTGEILAVRDVVIKAPSSSAGSTGMGSRIGAAAGRSAIFGGVSGAVGAAGAVVGEAVGAVAGARADDVRGEEITIFVEGQTVTIVQERSTPPLSPGERVRIVTGSSSGPFGGGSTKVVRDDQPATPSTAAVRRR